MMNQADERRQQDSKLVQIKSALSTPATDVELLNATMKAMDATLGRRAKKRELAEALDISTGLLTMWYGGRRVMRESYRQACLRIIDTCMAIDN